MEKDRDDYLAKARESLASAEDDYMSARYNSCANRCYYACFQAAIAALLHDGIRPAGQWGHEYVQVQFVGQLINRRKRYSPNLRQTLIVNLRARQTADYSPTSITHKQAIGSLARTRSFVQEIESRTST